MRRLFGFIAVACMAFTMHLRPAFAEDAVVFESWAEDVIYFLLPDRFENGDRSNDAGGMRTTGENAHLRHGFMPEDKGFFHGGDLRGIQQRLDYLQALGVTSVWMSPIFKNKAVQGRDRRNETSAGYHGYWVTDFTTVDPHFGTEEDLKSLIENLHAREMRAYFDIIANHTADVIQFRECMKGCSYRSIFDYPYNTQGRAGKKDINLGFDSLDQSRENFEKLTNANWAYSPVVGHSEKELKVPAWLNNPLYYHNRGDSTFSGESSQLGDFYGLDDLYTENPVVLEGMTEIYSEWIRKYQPDGFRIDTMKHVNLSFWQSFIPALRNTAREAGINDFYMFGEVFDHDPRVLSHYTNVGEVPAVLDFAFHSAATAVFANGEPTDKLRQLFANDDFYNGGGADARFMPTFLSNHDIGRIGYAIKSGQPRETASDWYQRARLAHAFMLFARGIPVIYYGDEQGFTGDGGDKDAREDMFPSKVISYQDNELLGLPGSTGDENFDAKHPLFLDFKRFIGLRKAHNALSRGYQIHRASEGGAGIYAFTRILPEEKIEYVVVVNSSSFERKASFYTYSPNMTFEYIMPETSRVEKSGMFRLLEVSVPAMDVVVLRAVLPVSDSDAAPKVKLDNLSEGDRVSGEVELCAVVNTSALARARFYATLDSGEKRLLGQDLSPVQFDESDPTSCESGALVYRYFFQTSEIRSNTPVVFTVEVDNLAGDKQVVSRSVVIDHRKPIVNVHYENGRKRNKMFAMAHGGEAMYPVDVTNNRASFLWPHGVKEISLFFYADGKKKRFDKPITLKYNYHLVPNMSDDEEPTVNLFINNGRRISGKQNFDKDRLARPDPLVIGRATRELPLGGGAVYLRGGMNSWNTDHEMIYAGNFAYSVDVQLDPGVTEFKFADEAWSDDINFGGAFGRAGLIGGGSAVNLRHTVANGNAGWHRFTFFATMDPSGRDYQFYMVERVSESDVEGARIVQRQQPGYTDKREIELNIRYQNAHERTHAFAVAGDGQSIPVSKLAGNSLKFLWPQKARRLWLYFFSKAEGINVIDAPVLLLYDQDVQYNIADNAVSIFINNRQRVNSSENFSATKDEKPTILIDSSTRSVDPLYPDRELYVRGSFNDWQARRPMVYEGGYQYRTTLTLRPGEYEFKISDAQWFHNTNLGLPFGRNGLTIGGHSKNIPLDISRRASGRYEFRFYMLPNGYSFYSLESKRK